MDDLDDLDDLLGVLYDHCVQLRADAVSWQQRAARSYVAAPDHCSCRNAHVVQMVAHNVNRTMQCCVREWLVLERHVAFLETLRAKRGEIVVILPDGGVA